MGHFLHFFGENITKNRNIVVFQLLFAVICRKIILYHGKKSQILGDSNADRSLLKALQQFCCLSGRLHLYTGANSNTGLLFRHFLLKLRRAEVVTVDELLELQTGKEVIEFFCFRGFAEGIFRLELNGGITADGGKIVGEIGRVLAVGQLLKELALHILGREIGIDSIQRTVLLQQLRGGLGAYTGHTGDIIGAVAHERLQVDELQRLQAVFLRKQLGGIIDRNGLTLLGAHQLYGHMAVNQLQAVPVAGENHAIPVRLTADTSHGTDHIVGLPAPALVDGDVHGTEHILHHGHLHSQLFRHAVTGSLVAVVLFMAEGGVVEVEGHADRIGLLLMLRTLEDIQKAVNSVGKQAISGSQSTDAVEGTVDDAVTV